jgi:hypothetical protein
MKIDNKYLKKRLYMLWGFFVFFLLMNFLIILCVNFQSEEINKQYIKIEKQKHEIAILEFMIKK